MTKNYYDFFFNDENRLRCSSDSALKVLEELKAESKMVTFIPLFNMNINDTIPSVLKRRHLEDIIISTRDDDFKEHGLTNYGREVLLWFA